MGGFEEYDDTGAEVPSEGVDAEGVDEDPEIGAGLLSEGCNVGGFE